MIIRHANLPQHALPIFLLASRKSISLPLRLSLRHLISLSFPVRGSRRLLQFHFVCTAIDLAGDPVDEARTAHGY